jgi:Tfp pilus assembly protein PilF
MLLAAPVPAPIFEAPRVSQRLTSHLALRKERGNSRAGKRLQQQTGRISESREGTDTVSKGKGDKMTAATKNAVFVTATTVLVTMLGALATAPIAEVPADAPKILRTTPADCATDVPDSLTRLTVTFDRKMKDKCWSWVQRYKDKFPQTAGTPSYDANATTCSFPVKLEPGKVYWVELNSPPYVAFQALDGTKAVQHVLVFATRPADGKATPIPADLADQARAVNAGPQSQPATATAAAASAAAPSDPEKRAAAALAAEGWRLWGQRKLPEAEKVLRQAVAKDPANANAWNGLGWAQQNQGELIEATRSFQKCLAVDPKVPGAWNGLGWIAKAQGRPEEAISYWRKAIAADPRASAARAGLAAIFMERGEFEFAEKEYQAALAADPTDASAKTGLATVTKARDASKAAKAAAEAWLVLLDAGEYGQTYDHASSLVKKVTTKAAWESTVKSAVAALGKPQYGSVKEPKGTKR